MLQQASCWSGQGLMIGKDGESNIDGMPSKGVGMTLNVFMQGPKGPNTFIIVQMGDVVAYKFPKESTTSIKHIKSNHNATWFNMNYYKDSTSHRGHTTYPTVGVMNWHIRVRLMPKWWNARSGILAPLGLPPHLHLSQYLRHLREWGSGGAEHGTASPVAPLRGCNIPSPSYGVAKMIPSHA